MSNDKAWDLSRNVLCPHRKPPNQCVFCTGIPYDPTDEGKGIMEIAAEEWEKEGEKLEQDLKKVAADAELYRKKYEEAESDRAGKQRQIAFLEEKLEADRAKAQGLLDIRDSLVRENESLKADLKAEKAKIQKAFSLMVGLAFALGLSTIILALVVGLIWAIPQARQIIALW